MKLSDREWKPCRLSKLGKVESGKDIYAMERIEGNVPYVTSGSQNNGIGYFVANENKTLDKGYIAFNRNGAVGLAFYHPYWSVMGNDCRKIHISKADENIYVGLFVSTAISMQSKSFSYSRKLGTARANKLQVMLPVDDNDEPDYQFMENYMKELMVTKRKQYQEYVEQRLAELGIDVKNTIDVKKKRRRFSLDLDSRNYKPFRLSNLFMIDKGVYLPKWKIVSGKYPFITAKAGNNGISDFIGNEPLFTAGKITVEKIKLNSYYQPQSFYCSHDVSVLDNGCVNQYCAHFICLMIMRNGSKYSYGRQAQMNVVKREVVLLPVDNNNKPDYDFMEECGRKIMAKKYIQYLNYLQPLSEKEGG